MSQTVALTLLAAMTTGFAVGVLLPDARRRRPTAHSPSTPPPNVPVMPPGRVTFAQGHRRIPHADAAAEIAVTAEEADVDEHRPRTRHQAEAERRHRPRSKRRKGRR